MFHNGFSTTPRERESTDVQHLPADLQAPSSPSAQAQAPSDYADLEHLEIEMIHL